MPDSPVQEPGSRSGAEPAELYRVLARRHRPQRLSELIGQEALVRTLGNALRTGRIAHAFLLTGIRGVGKTSTARIIARALNCIGPDGKGQATPEPCGVCEPCIAIADSRHIDVLEMDAATRTGIDDIREIVDSVRYAPTSARYKVYIIDEVHMLSTQAFNGLLKTLEEPPPQTIFIFATTEVRKVPVTVLSRCQRLDLRRVEGPQLSRHLAGIAEGEQVAIEPDALALIVRAAEGSVRDGLSLLDQAITLLGGSAPITVRQVEDMLGLADRGRVLDLFERVMRGDVKEALDRLGELHDLGSEPETVVREMLEISHWLTRIKVVPAAAEARDTASADAARAKEMAGRLSIPVLARAWQMLLKGLDELQAAPSPLLAAEMLLVRLAYVADLPPPAELRALLGTGGAAAPAPRAEPVAGPAVAPAAPMDLVGPAEDAIVAPGLAEAPPTEAPVPAQPQTFAEAVELFRRNGQPRLYSWLRDHVRLVRFAPGQIEIERSEQAPPAWQQEAADYLSRWTATPWRVRPVDEPGTPTLAEQAAAAQRARIDALAGDPRIKPILERFPGARIVDVRSSVPAP
ncbi:MAG TPA: DNA polymerase III subunit gamma/tau [Geminicoccaceae bacterium]|nr:DNA polymerase III subunit gamma/tau [Geminicoccaceae bacterium]